MRRVALAAVGVVVLALIVLAFAMGWITVSDNRCIENVGGTGKTHGTDYPLTGTLRRDDGSVALRCVDGAER